MSAARRLFEERGDAGTATADIVRDAGVTRGALYHHFVDKEDLLRAVVIDIQEELIERVIAAALAKEPNAWEVFTAGWVAFLGVADQPGRRHRRCLPSLDLDAWRQSSAAAFQDFIRFELYAGEVVGIGDLAHLHDAEAISSALTRSGATSIVGELPSGLETRVGTLFGAPVDLSTGQWQKLALGRAMMRPVPLLVVLDEPTAALDAHAERELFERYAAGARDAAAAAGSVTVLVSHRFSTVRMADIIVVLDDGRIVEVGDHQRLVAAGGLYAELYELQARSYR